MTRLKLHIERHAVSRIGWLRAAVLGANDGIISTASLIVGVAAANASGTSILFTGVAGLVAGAMSMAAGEYVSVSSQSDTENADIARDRALSTPCPVLLNRRAGQRTRTGKGSRANRSDREPSDPLRHQPCPDRRRAARPVLLDHRYGPEAPGRTPQSQPA